MTPPGFTDVACLDLAAAEFIVEFTLVAGLWVHVVVSP